MKLNSLSLITLYILFIIILESSALTIGVTVGVIVGSLLILVLIICASAISMACDRRPGDSRGLPPSIPVITTY